MIKGIIRKVLAQVIEEEKREIIESFSEEFKRKANEISNEVLREYLDRVDWETKEKLKKVRKESEEEWRKVISTIKKETKNEVKQIIRLFAEIDEERRKKIEMIRGEKTKIIIDGENFESALRELKKEEKMIPIIDRFRNEASCYYYESFDSGEENLIKKIEWEELKKKGIELKLIPIKRIIDQAGLRKKSLLDSAVVVEIMKTILEPEYGRIILFAGDSDYALPLREVKKWGVKVTVVSSRKHLSFELRRIANEVYYIENIKN